MYSSTILDLGKIWREVVNFTPLPLCHYGKKPRYPLDKRLAKSLTPAEFDNP
jgi:predicted solute-binding protein